MAVMKMTMMLRKAVWMPKHHLRGLVQYYLSRFVSEEVEATEMQQLKKHLAERRILELLLMMSMMKMVMPLA